MRISFSRPWVGIVVPPFINFGIRPQANTAASNNNIQGLQVNGQQTTFSDCGGDLGVQFLIYTINKGDISKLNEVHMRECDLLFANMLLDPADSVIPDDSFFIGETSWGECGCYIQNDKTSNITGLNIGFR